MGSGTLGSGTYPCVIVEFSDNIKFTPSTNSSSGNCLTTQEETMDVCRAGGGANSQLSDGTTTTCTNGDDRVAMYLSTGSSSTTGVDAFNPPTSLGDASHGFNLANALSVSGSALGKFVVNPSGKVCDGDDASCDGGGNNGSCRMEPPTFTFSPL
ncbi:MAG: hypothetical protein AB7G93_13985 [Bdellovibrionales bacterium]